MFILLSLNYALVSVRIYPDSHKLKVHLLLEHKVIEFNQVDLLWQVDFVPVRYKLLS